MPECFWVTRRGNGLELAQTPNQSLPGYTESEDILLEWNRGRLDAEDRA